MPVTGRPDFSRLARRLARGVAQGVEDAITVAEREVGRRYNASATGAPGVGMLQRRSGLLAAAPRREVRGGPPPARITARLYIPQAGDRTLPAYAGVHETGGVIRSNRPGGYLAIPTAAVRGNTAYGKFSRGPRDYPGGFFLRSYRGSLGYFIATGRSRGAMLTKLFTLVRSVRIPARPVWAQTNATSRGAMRAAFLRRVNAELRAA